jgi:hypothetical protein
MGDIYGRKQEAYQAYWDIIEKEKLIPGTEPVMKGPTRVPVIPGMEPMQQFFELHQIPRMREMMKELKELLMCGLYFIKKPNWIEPPITAIGIDQFTQPSVTINAVCPAETLITPLDFIVPDRHIAVIAAFGHQLEASAAFSDVRWTIKVNGVPLSNYTRFIFQIGEPVHPTFFCKPLVLKWKDRIQLFACSISGAPHQAFARWCGWVWGPPTISVDGTFSEFHTV